MKSHIVCFVALVLVVISFLATCISPTFAALKDKRRQLDRVDNLLLNELKKLEKEISSLLLSDKSVGRPMTRSLRQHNRCQCIRAPCPCAEEELSENTGGGSLPTFAGPSVPTAYSAPWSSSGSGLGGSSTSLPTLGITPGKLPNFARIGSPSFGVRISPSPSSVSNPTYKLPDFKNLFNNNQNPTNSYTLPNVPGNAPGSLPIFSRPTTPVFSSSIFSLPSIGPHKHIPGKIPTVQIPTLPPKTGPTPLTPPRFPSMITNPPKLPLPKAPAPGPAPSSTNNGGSTAANWALAQQGKPYSQAQGKRHGPDYFDCSALVKEAWSRAGKNLPETTHGYPGRGMKQVSANEMKPGDIVYRTGHVGMYVGNGKIVSAESTAGVKERPVAQYQRVIGFTTVYRP